MKKEYNETFRLTTTRPVAILMIVLAVFVFGIISYSRLSLNLMPEISYPSLTVRTEYPGTAPEEIETIISRPLEQALGIVNNLITINSISKAGLSDVVLEFSWDTDMNLAIQEVREKVDQVFLPKDVTRPLILRYDPSLDPIMRFGLYGSIDLFTLRRIADEELRRELETLPGVAAVKIKGGLKEEIRVEMNEDQLTVLNIGISEVNQRLSQENINLAGGNLKEGDTEYLVRTLNEFRTIDEIGDLIIGTRNGADIRVKNIGSVFRTHKDREVITRINGIESVDIEIYKEADANIVQVAEGVRNKIFGTPEQQALLAQQQSGTEQQAVQTRGGGPRGGGRRGGRMGSGGPQVVTTDFLANTLPPGVQITNMSDQSVFIKSSIDEVRNTAVLGGMLAVVVLYFFLRNILSTFIIGLTIPISVIATFAPMYLFDVSLNIMSLGGLALGIGMLVDNSIVVLESIFRCRGEGDSKSDAAVRGTGEVGGAVFASTLTTIAVFFPIVFVEGIAGQVFGDMALVVVFSLLASLLAALFFIPMLASRQFPQSGAGESLSTIRSMEFLRLPSFDFLKTKINALRENTSASTITGFYSSIPKIIILSLIDLVKKIYQSLYAIILLTAEFVITILHGILFLMTGFAKDAGIKNSGSDQVIPAARAALFWEEMLRFPPKKSLFSFYSQHTSNLMRPAGRGEQTGPAFRSSIMKGIAWILFPVTVIYILFRFILEMAIGLVGKLAILLPAALLAAGMSFLVGVITILLIILIPAVGIFNTTYSKISDYYPIIIRNALRHRAAVIILSLVSFLICIFYLLPNLGQELIPELHRGEFTLELTYPVGTPVEQTAENSLQIENMAGSVSEVKQVSAVIGTELNSTSTLAEEGEHTARINVVLHEGGTIVEKEFRVIGELRKQLSYFSGVTTKLSRPVLFSFKTPVEVEITGYSLETLQELSDEIVNRLADIPGLTDIKSNIRRGNPEIIIKYDRAQLAKNNLNIFQVASLVKNKVQGEVATEFRDRERKIDILVKVREQDKANLADLYRLVINPGGITPIPLSSVASIAINDGPSEIRRINQQRSALVSANLSGADLGSVSRNIDQVLNAIPKPADFQFQITGQNREMQTSLDSLQFALLLAIFLIYVVMASQFESLIHPFVILSTIPLAVIGVIVMLYTLKIAISIVVFIGMIMLAGIVVNNAIVFVDYINQLRRRGMNKEEAIMLAGSVRLRPILMTTTTTVLGLLPMALGLGEGAEIRTPMAITVIAGLISSTVLTLVVIPTVYSVMDRKN